MNPSFVTRGLDPRIHDEVPHAWNFRLDCRVELGNDEKKLNQPLNRLNRNQTFRVLAHLAEKSRFFDPAFFWNANSIPSLLNRKVKP